MRSRVPLILLPFSVDSHAWQAVSLDFIWQCVLNDIRYQITHLMILPQGTIQLTLHDRTAVHFPYKGPRLSEFVLFLYHDDSLPNLNPWVRVRYQLVRRALLRLYRHPFIFRKKCSRTRRTVNTRPCTPCRWPSCLTLLNSCFKLTIQITYTLSS